MSSRRAGWSVLAALVVVVTAAGCTPAWRSLFEPRPEGGSGQGGDGAAGTDGAAGGARAPEVKPVDVRATWAPPVEPERSPPETSRQQGSSAADLSDRIFTYYIEHIGRTLYIQTDKALYRPTETVWVKSWDVERRALEGHATDRGLLMQLVSPEGEVLSSKVVRQLSGEGTNELRIPEGAPSGEYLIRVSTDDGVRGARPVVVVGREEAPWGAQLVWGAPRYRPGQQVEATVQVDVKALGGRRLKPGRAMIHIDGERLPEVEVKLGASGRGALRFQLPATLARGQGVVSVRLDAGDATGLVSDVIPIDNSGLRFEAWPEGGALVEGLPARVYFEARDGSGVPVDVQGHIEGPGGGRLVDFTAAHRGMGRFELPPLAGAGYKAVVTAPEAYRGSHALPAVKAEGCVLQSVDDLDTQRAAVRVLVWCREPTAVLVTAVLREKLIDVAYVIAERDKPAVVFLRSRDDTLSKAQGIVRVTVWDDWLTPLAERLVYRNRRDTLDLQVVPSRGVVNPGDAVDLHVFARDGAGAPVKARVALALVDENTLSTDEDTYGTILSRVFLEPELVGPIEEPDAYFNLADPASGRAMDLLMGTRGYRRFEWAQIVEPRAEGGEEAAPSRTIGTRGAIVYAAPEFGEGLKGVADVRPRSAGLARARRVKARLGGIDARYLQAPPTDALIEPADESAEAPPSGGAPVEAPASGGAGGEAATTGLSRQQILDTIRANQAALGECATGSSTVIGTRVVIKPSGAVASATVTGDAKGTTEAACVVKVVERLRFPTFQGKALTINYPFVLKGLGWSPVRLFPLPLAERAFEDRQRDARETALWMPEVELGDDGHAVVTVPLPNVTTQLRATVEGLGGGRVGRGTARVRTAPPFAASAQLPERVVAGDTFEIPVALQATGTHPVDVGLVVQLEGGLTRGGDLSSSVTVKPGADQAFPLTLQATAPGPASVRVIITQGSTTTELRQALRVEPQGFPRELGGAGLLTPPSVQLALPEDPNTIPGSATAEVHLFPGHLGVLMAARAGLADEPGLGRLLGLAFVDARALALLRASAPQSDLTAELQAELNFLSVRLSDFVVQGTGGFAPLPGLQADLVWTALAARVLKVWLEVTPIEPVQAAFDAATRWLQGHRDGAGGFQSRDEAEGWAPRPVTSAFATWAVAEAGLEGFPSEIGASSSAAAESKDPLLLALAVNAMWSAPRLKAAALDPTRRLAGMQDAAGAWPAAAHSPLHASPDLLRVETGALALLAIARSGGLIGPGRSAAAWLVAQQRPDGTWGHPLTTILVLDALERFQAAAPRPGATGAGGALTLKINGQSVATRPWAANQSRALTINGLEASLREGAGQVELSTTGRGDLPWLLRVHRASRAPAPGDAALTLAVEPLPGPLAVGQRGELRVRVKNGGDAPRARAFISLPVPAGLRIDPADLEATRGGAVGAALSVDGRRVHLALEGLPPGAERVITLPVTAAWPGSFQPGAAWIELEGRPASRAEAPGPAATVIR